MGKYHKAWDVSYKNFPLKGNVLEQIKFLLQYAVLAPSTHNIQPWLFRVHDAACDFLFDPAAYLPYGDHEKRYGYISIGAAIENFYIACTAFRMEPKIVYLSDKMKTVRVEVQRSEGFDHVYSKKLEAIINRVNVRGVFEKRSIEPAILTEFQNGSTDINRCSLHLCTTRKNIQKVAEMTASGLRKAHGNTLFRQEVARHIISNISKKPRGIPGYTMNLPLVPSLIVPKIIFHKDISFVLAKLNLKSVMSSPLVCVVTTENWGEESWIDAGRMAERTIIEGQVNGISSSIYVAATEFEDTAQKLQSVLNTEEKPLFLFCMGYMKKKNRKHSQRIPVAEKIVK